MWRRAAECWALLGEEEAAARVVRVAGEEVQGAAGMVGEVKTKLIRQLEEAVRETQKIGDQRRLPPLAPELSTGGPNPMVSTKLKVTVGSFSCLD